MMQRLTGLAPVIGPDTRMLVLGSFPGVASLRDQQYYAHPQNHFWKILQALWPEHPLPDRALYAERCAWALDRGLGIWDVYASCEREGSLDSAIRNAVVNDFAALRVLCPELRLIGHNGGESYKHFSVVQSCLSAAGPSQGAKAPSGGSEDTQVPSVGALLSAAGPSQGAKAPSGGSEPRVAGSVGVIFLRLPSTSPANASWSFERKLSAWRAAAEQAGLL